MTRPSERWLADIRKAIAEIRVFLNGSSLADAKTFHSVKSELSDIGEAVNALPDDLLATEPGIPWRQIVGMRNNLVHRYFSASVSLMEGTVGNDLRELEEAVGRMQQRLADPGAAGGASE